MGAATWYWLLTACANVSVLPPAVKVKLDTGTPAVVGTPIWFQDGRRATGTVPVGVVPGWISEYGFFR